MLQRPRTKIIIIKRDFQKPISHHICLPTHSFSSRFLSSPQLSFSFFHFLSFSLAHTLSLPHSHSVTPSLSLSPINHHNYQRNSGRIYRRKSIRDLLGSICFQYFKVRTLSLKFLYFVSFFTNLSNLSVICDLI